MRLLKQWSSRATTKNTILLLLITICAHSFLQAQTITLSAKNETLVNVFKQVQRQSGYIFWYKNNTLKNAAPVTLSIKSASLKEALDRLFTDQPLSYEIVDKTIVVKPKENPVRPTKEETAETRTITVTGMVTDEENQPLPNVNVMVRQTQRGAITDAQGRYQVEAAAGDVLLFSSTGYQIMEIPAGGRKYIVVRLARDVKSLDETVIIGYGKTSRRFNTGTVSKVSSAEIERQPVSNPLAALAGRAAGVMVTQSNGAPGSGINIQIRGVNSLAQGSDPLYLIDGVPFDNTSLTLLGVGSSNRGQSAFASINPNDIESIEILKDADATAIYGSRGANGVVMITTKKGKSGKTQVDMNIRTGTGKVTRMIDYLKTVEYIAMRREGFRNDNVTPTITNAKDLLAWDTTRYTNWQDMLIGGTAKYTDVNVSASGGTGPTRYLISGFYHNETTVYPGSARDRKAGAHFSINHTSANNKFKASMTSSYSYDDNRLYSSDLTSGINLAPNAPLPYDSLGRLNWSEGGQSFSNPLATLFRKGATVTDNVVSSLNIGYEIVNGLVARVTGGLTYTSAQQLYTLPKASYDPATNPVSSAKYGSNRIRTLIAEPQLEYSKKLTNSKFSVLIGSTWQNSNTLQTLINASNFQTDALIESAAAAGSVNSTTVEVPYRYTAGFARVNYNLQDKYLLNLTARRDGSSRFGPNRQFANFGAAGIAWLFGAEKWMQDHIPVISYGKLRSSYGVTGNDQIGDFQYLDTYTNSFNSYQGITGIVPSRLYNPDYGWETNRKLEAALELGLFRDRIFFTMNYFRNRSSNQLVAYRLPDQVGFASILQNFNALVQNRGWEIELNTTNLKKTNLRWASSFNITFNKNQLLEFPGIESSSYANTYVIGKPISIIKRIDYTGVDPETGTYQFTGTTVPTDQTIASDLSPKFFGGFGNELSYGSFELSVFFQFVKQMGRHFLAAFGGTNAPGTLYNQPTLVLDRWQRSGDITDIQRFTAVAGAARTAYLNFIGSDGGVIDASFVRMKNLSLAYVVPATWLPLSDGKRLKLYLQGQNLFTFTGYKGLDPETQLNYLPPLRVWVGGIQFTF